MALDSLWWCLILVAAGIEPAPSDFDPDHERPPKTMKNKRKSKS